MIRSAIQDDADSIIRLYNHYVLNSTVTFEEEAVSSQQMVARRRLLGRIALNPEGGTSGARRGVELSA